MKKISIYLRDKNTGSRNYKYLYSTNKFKRQKDFKAYIALLFKIDLEDLKCIFEEEN